MKQRHIQVNGKQIEILGFANEVMAFSLENNPKAVELADYALHRGDMSLAKHSLESLPQIENGDTQEALWRSAISHYAKCFANGVRSRLNGGEIFGGNKVALIVHSYFLDLRDKHFAHDVNSFDDAIPIAMFDNNSEEKIVDIICFQTNCHTLNEVNFTNMVKLVTEAISWIEKKFDELHEQLLLEVRKLPIEEIKRFPVPKFRVPTNDEIKTNRKKRRK